MTTDSNSPITAPPPAPPLVPEVARTPVRRAGPSRWTAFGNGVGIEIRDKDLQVTIVRVRPSETGVLGAATVTDYRTRPAAEWGTELLGFFRKVGAGHIAATVLLPRRDVIVRTLHLPGVQDNDLESAVSLQMDSLHPFTDEDVCFSWARLGKTPYVLIGLARRQVVDTYSSLFAEAGLKIVSFTFSAAAIYSALRIITTPPPGFVIAHKLDNGFELYGESEARPVYSATLPTTRERALEIASSELRLDPRTEPAGLHDLLPKPSLYPADYDPQSPVFGTNALTYAAALAGACPWLGIEGNVLPAELRRGSSRVRLIPTITLAVILAALLIVLGVESSWFDSRYLAVLQHQISLSEPAAKRVDAIDRAVAATRARSQSLDDFKRRPRLDMDSLAEVTKLIPAPGWVSGLDMDRQTIQIAGEAEQAATLLKTFDNSPLFERSEFSMPIMRATAGEMFRVRSARTAPIPGFVAPPAQPIALPKPVPGAAK